MRRICVLIMVMALGLMTTGAKLANAEGDFGVISSSNQVIHTHIDYNPYGVAVHSTTTDTSTITSSREGNGTSTTTRITVTESTWHGGSLKPDTVHTTSNTTSSDGSLSNQNITDTYTYNGNGVLTGCHGTGTYSSTDGETGHSESGTITRNFEIRDGQALLTTQALSGTMYDKNGAVIGSSSSTTTFSYAYLGGSWVVSQSMETSSRNYTEGGVTVSETVTKTTTYSRDAMGIITGISTTATGTRTVQGDMDPETGERATHTFALTYSAVYAFDPGEGWYLSSEDYTWTETAESIAAIEAARARRAAAAAAAQDPVLYGSIVGGPVTINGVTYVQISPDSIDVLDGNGLQVLEGGDGEIFLIQCDAGESEALMQAQAQGQKVMVFGDIAGAQAGENGETIVLVDINEGYYNAGVVIGDYAEQLANDKGLYETQVQQEGWYNANKAAISGQKLANAELWHNITNDSRFQGNSWRQGLEFLIQILK